MIQFNTVSSYANARGRLRKCLKQRVRDDVVPNPLRMSRRVIAVAGQHDEHQDGENADQAGAVDSSTEWVSLNAPFPASINSAPCSTPSLWATR